MDAITVEEHIPAFSMWKMLNETVPVLRKGDCSEASIKKLAAIIQSKDGCNIFINHKDPMVSFKQFQDIGDYYKAFTTWILGQFFYLFTLEKFEKLHDIIIDMQLCILEQLSRTQLHIYHDLSEQYCKAFLQIVQHIDVPIETIFTLEVFLPEHFSELEEKLNLQQVFIEISSKSQALNILEKLMKFIKAILVERFIFYSIGHNSKEVLDTLLLLLQKGKETIRVTVVDIFIEIIKKSRNAFYQHNSDIIKILSSFSDLFEQFVYKIYGSEICLKGNKELEQFEGLLVSYLEIEKEWKIHFKNIERLKEYLFQKQFGNDNIKPSVKVLLACSKDFKMSVFAAGNFKTLHLANLRQLTLPYHFKQIIFEDLLKSEYKFTAFEAYHADMSITYNELFQQIMESLEATMCENNVCSVEQFITFCKNLTSMLIEIKLELIKNHEVYNKIVFFVEEKLMLLFLSKLLNHTNECKHLNISTEQIFEFFFIFILLTNSKNVDCIFDFIVQPLSHLLNLNYDCLSQDFIGGNWELKKKIRDFHHYLTSNQNITINSFLKKLKYFFEILSSGIFDTESCQMKNFELIFNKICRCILGNGNSEQITTIIEIIPNVLILFENRHHLINQVLNQALMTKNSEVQEKTVLMLSTFVCTINSEFIKILKWDCNSYKLISKVLCVNCNIQSVSQNAKEDIKSKMRITDTMIQFQKITLEESFDNLFLKHALGHLSGNSANMKIATLSLLPSFSNHVKAFHSTNITTLWAGLAGDANEEVRKKYVKVIGSVLSNAEVNTTISQDVQKENQKVILRIILDITKKSLKCSNYDLQYSILNVIDEIIQIGSIANILEIQKILLYFIMIPTSKYSLIAVNKCFTLARRNGFNTTEIYNQNKREYCDVIAHLCAVNQVLINYNLITSLEKISPMLGFYGSKYFVSQECNYLLPFFVSKVVKVPTVTKLIEEMAQVMEMELSEMLSNKYGYIFIHIFLENLPKDEFKQCMMYLERTSGMSGPSLRKRNFRIILNELLLNFHEKQERVSLALSLLMEEDSDSKVSSIQEYLQCHFLGVLLYFDVKFISKTLCKDKFLLSLADLFRYMGPKHIMPLRFKIIAMLQTSNYENFPDLNCEVWDAFVRSCELESLGPQLALILVSILPLLEHCPSKVNNIFKYLVVENEHHMKNYISDLFFVHNSKIDYAVSTVIKKYLSYLKKCSLKEKMLKFMKYLSHEAMEVRIQSLKHLKNYLEQSREELDKMILDYNGIDCTIVELIDILTTGCREKDKALKLACGEVIGELGAIEPSHLPRRYLHEQSMFSFYINDDSFIVNSLNELIKALQTEKNTQSMDRYSLAIQETLKLYGISPHNNSAVWNEFPQTQREVMLPLLSSRYMIAQPILASNLPTPIYGSNSGASFQAWLYNWTCSLISSLPENDKKSLLNVCLPSMKQDNRILLHFLPYILLHALLEGGNGISKKSLAEIQTITNSFTDEKPLDPKVLNLRPIPITGIKVEPQSVTPEELKQTQCTKVVFLILDFLDRWLREWHWQKGLDGRENEHYSIIQHFLNGLCKLQLAKCNYHCGEYPRALLYLEDYMSENSTEISVHLSFLAEIYAQLEEPDGVDGATKLQHNEPSVEQRILALEVSGKLADATTCYEQMLQPLQLNHIQGLVQCYLDLDNVNTALNFVRGALDKQLDFGNMLLEMQAEPLWRLGQYDELNDLLKKPDLMKSNSWGVEIGRALLSFKEGRRDDFQTVLGNMMREQVESFGAATIEEGAYQHGYAYISKLHALNELEQVEKIVHELLLKPYDQQFINSVISRLTSEWSLRLKIVQESVRSIEPLLCLRRVSLNLAKSIVKDKVPGAMPKLNSLIADCWIQSAKTAREAGMHQQAYTYLIKAEEYVPTTLFLEKAKLHWLREEHEQALTTLQRGLEIILPQGSEMTGLSLETRKMCAEAKLLIATYNDEVSNVDVEMNLLHYKKAVDIYKEWEKSMVCLAQYYDKIFQTYNQEERDSKGGDIQLYMINYFGKSLQYGTTYIYQSMPRLLSIWFDYGTRLLEATHNSTKEERKNTLFRMTKLIDSFLERLPTYVFLTAFSQLVSRICHPQREVYGELKCIIIKLLQEYPQQSLWMIISVIKSSYAVRSKRCAEILCDSRLKTTALIKLVKDFTSLAEKLIELCNKEIPSDVNATSVSILLRSLPRMLAKHDFSEIMMPTYKFRKLILPNPDFKSSQHNPFPNHYVHIVGIEDELTVLTSLQRPRKIVLKGSDGKGYIYMLKPKDDLRKDFRLMEFNDIVNHLLARDGEARQRRLCIRLYSVAPLNEECGVIEWVPNLIGLRPVLMKLYKQRGLAMKGRELKEACCNIRDPLDKKRDIFLKKLLPKHPPILNEWFRKTFPDAQSWLTARTAYIRTTAVMSMAGYILGLGDRHGENISLDSTCGDVVHVDFNCLFNKGEKFDWPERVPFRLTHNMVAAMGPLGVEGLFRKSCAITLRVLRVNTNTLMSIVAPFVYDPLVSWPRNISALSNVHNAERTNEEALDHIRNIELRLQGRVKTRHRTSLMPLSVDGQTNYLINEAMSIENLCQMYIGWGPYL